MFLVSVLHLEPCVITARLAMPAVGMAVLVASLVAYAPPAGAEAPTGQTVVGTVVRAYVEHALPSEAGGSTDFASPLTWVASSDGGSVRVPTTALADVPVGTRVAVTLGGRAADSATTADHVQPARAVLAASVVTPASPGDTAPAPGAAQPTAVTDSVTIALVAPAGSAPDATTPEQVAAQVSGPVAQFWATQSHGAVRIGVADAHDWIATAADCSDPERLWSEAAAAIGFTAGPGRHLLLYVPSTDSRCALGLAEVGASLHGGGSLYVQRTWTSVIAHELGHNFGLLHSGRQECVDAVDREPCVDMEYGDLYDVMGASWSAIGSLNDVQAARLGFLPADQVRTVTPASRPAGYALAPLSASSGVRGIRLVTGSGEIDYLEYRAPTGQDGYLGDPGANYFRLQPGVLIHRVDQAYSADSSTLLDATPSGGDGYASDSLSAFPPGRTVLVAGGQFAVTVTGTSTTSASVTIAPRSLHRPVGHLDGVSVSGSGVLTAHGWAFDPDLPAAAGIVDLYVDRSGVRLTADQPRPDIGATHPAAGDRHGFTVARRIRPGQHTVCAYGIDATGTDHTLLGCRTVRFADHPAFGRMESARISGRLLTVRGWALDADTPGTPTRVRISIDGAGRAVVADHLRNDVGVTFPGVGARHGFTATIPVIRGRHTVCVYASDTADAGRQTALGCRTVVS